MQGGVGTQKPGAGLPTQLVLMKAGLPSGECSEQRLGPQPGAEVTGPGAEEGEQQASLRC
jgi:hypothetical protein